MTTEVEVVVPVLRELNKTPSGVLPTRTVRERVKEALALSAEDMKPLANRSDRKIDQTIRNLKSHRKTPGNPFFEGLIEDVERGYKITQAGRKYLTAGK